MIYQVAVSFPGKQPLTYTFDGSLEKGQMVDIPLGKRSALGCILGSTTDSTFQGELKEIKNIHEGWKISSHLMNLYEWMAQYYHYSLGQLIDDSEPKILKRPRPLVPIKGEEKKTITPYPEQKQVIDKILETSSSFKSSLIHGVTGSGKTVIYLELIKAIIKSGKSVLLLVPEINLTPQLLNYFTDFLAVNIFKYHSELSDSERFQVWKAAKENTQAALYIGVRSSVFMPIQNLGLIIVDEEHDQSFKQDDRCPYNARDVATKRAQLENIPIVLGSATPSLESYSRFKQVQSENYFALRKRANDSILPKIQLIDARSEKGVQNPDWPFVPETINEISIALEKKEQVLVFLNRLGFAQFIQCRSCGHQFYCPNCSITLRFFKQKNCLECQHCEYQEPMPSECPKCANLTLMNKGFGTEKIQEVLQGKFPHLKISRFDRDAIKTFKQLEETLENFHSGKSELMIGTQMLSKGHNFEKVKTVVMLGVDQQMNFPDFRSTERAYQLLTQVAGRSGRYSQDGKVLIQTLNPYHPIFQQVNSTDWEKFYEGELQVRKHTHNAPYTRMAIWHFYSRFQDRLVKYLLQESLPAVQKLVSQHFPKVEVLGPRAAFIEKRANLFSWNYMLKSDDATQLHNFLKTLEVSMKLPSGISAKIDIDPYHVL